MSEEMVHREDSGDEGWLESLTSEERTIFASLFTTVLIFTYYFVRLFALYRSGSPEPATVYRLWATVIIMTIVLNIIVAILTHILFAVAHAVVTQRPEEPSMVKDERDKIIQLRGSQISCIAMSVGVLFSMLTRCWASRRWRCTIG